MQFDLPLTRKQILIQIIFPVTLLIIICFVFIRNAPIQINSGTELKEVNNEYISNRTESERE